MEINVTVKQELNDNRVADLICAGFEGGIGYWARVTGYKKPEKVFEWDLSSTLGGQVYRYVQYPMSEGGAVLMQDTENDDQWELNREKILAGLAAMASKYPRHWRNFMDEQEDSETGDVFIQCCLFGELVYG